MEAELPLDETGVRLRRAREAVGLSRADIAGRTKIAERHIIAIEEGRLADLPARMYAVGFARSFAREVGLDENEIARLVRAEVEGVDRDADGRGSTSSFEPGDPARVPPLGLALIAALAALAVVLGGMLVWRSYWSPGVSLPSLAPEATPVPTTGTGPTEAPAIAAPPAAVVFTALEPGIWVKFTDAGGAQLMQKQMAQGESYTVPANAQGPHVWTARPDALAITVGGRAVPRLSDRQITLKDVPVSAAALLARAPAPVATASASAAPSAAARVERPARRAAPAAPVPAAETETASPTPTQPSTVSE